MEKGSKPATNAEVSRTMTLLPDGLGKVFTSSFEDEPASQALIVILFEPYERCFVF